MLVWSTLLLLQYDRRGRNKDGKLECCLAISPQKNARMVAWPGGFLRRNDEQVDAFAIVSEEKGAFLKT